MKKKQLTALLLSAAMALSLLSGCGGNAASSGSSASQESAGETESQGIREYTAFFAVPGTEINDDNEIQAAIADITGARVKETWLTGQTAQEAVGTMIAGGEYPDFIDGSDGQIQLYEAGALVALDDYLDAKVFAGQKGTKMDPDPKDVEGYNTFIERFKKTLPIMKAATETMK